jgi:hypothetical protein
MLYASARTDNGNVDDWKDADVVSLHLYQVRTTAFYFDRSAPPY